MNPRFFLCRDIYYNCYNQEAYYREISLLTQFAEPKFDEELPNHRGRAGENELIMQGVFSSVQKVACLACLLLLAVYASLKTNRQRFVFLNKQRLVYFN